MVIPDRSFRSIEVTSLEDARSQLVLDVLHFLARLSGRSGEVVDLVMMPEYELCIFTELDETPPDELTYSPKHGGYYIGRVIL